MAVSERPHCSLLYTIQWSCHFVEVSECPERKKLCTSNFPQCIWKSKHLWSLDGQPLVLKLSCRDPQNHQTPPPKHNCLPWRRPELVLYPAVNKGLLQLVRSASDILSIFTIQRLHGSLMSSDYLLHCTHSSAHPSSLHFKSSLWKCSWIPRPWQIWGRLFQAQRQNPALKHIIFGPL